MRSLFEHFVTGVARRCTTVSKPASLACKQTREWATTCTTREPAKVGYLYAMVAGAILVLLTDRVRRNEFGRGRSFEPLGTRARRITSTGTVGSLGGGPESPCPGTDPMLHCSCTSNHESFLGFRWEERCRSGRTHGGYIRLRL